MNNLVQILLLATALGIWSAVWEIAKGFKSVVRRLDRLEELISKGTESKSSP